MFEDIMKIKNILTEFEKTLDNYGKYQTTIMNFVYNITVITIINKITVILLGVITFKSSSFRIIINFSQNHYLRYLIGIFSHPRNTSLFVSFLKSFWQKK